MRSKKGGFLSAIKTSLQQSRVGDMLLARGVITPADLQHALSVQKTSGKPLGQIFVESAAISRSELTMLLWRQTALRTCATAVLAVASLSSMSPKKSYAADLDGSSGGRVILASTSQEFTRAASYPALMGMKEKRSANLKPFTKWTGMLSKFESQMRSGKAGSAIKAMEASLSNIRSSSIKTMADAVNDMMNAKPYILDKNNWGASDYWATPTEFLSRGGDCEDFAIAKYAALRTLGVPEDRMRVAIVQDLQKNIPHAVLVVYTEDGAYILDNQNKNMVSAEHGSRYRPIYSINRQAWWLHSAPGSTMVASAR